MTIHRRIAIGLILLPWLRADQPPKELLGRWVPLARTFDRMGEIMTFHQDGTVDSSIAFVEEAAYRVDGAELVEFSPSNAGPEQRTRIEFTGLDQLRIGENVMKRQGAPGDAKRPIVEEWVGMREVAGKRHQAHFVFYPDGRRLFVLPILERTGKYTIQGLTMRVEMMDFVREGEFRIEGDLLTVPGLRAGQGLRGTPDKFRRHGDVPPPNDRRRL
jgi:hypothetical protein